MTGRGPEGSFLRWLRAGRSTPASKWWTSMRRPVRRRRRSASMRRLRTRSEHVGLRRERLPAEIPSRRRVRVNAWGWDRAVFSRGFIRRLPLPPLAHLDGFPDR